MVAPNVMQAVVLTYSSSGAEQHTSSTVWYETITVTNNSGQPLYVAVDGGTATLAGGGPHQFVIQNNAQAVFGNEQQLPQANETYAGAWNAGTTKFSNGNMGAGSPALANQGAVSGSRDQSQAVNWSAQQGYQDANGTPTFVSVIPAASTSGTVTVEFQ